MPTAARLVAAVLLGIVGWIASGLVRPLLPEITNFGWFNEVNGGIGLLVGWTVIGSRAGRGTAAAVGNGLTGAAALIFWGLFVQAGHEMLSRALKKRYDGAMEAVVDIFSIAFGYLAVMATPLVLGWIVLGAIAAALAAEGADRRWP